MNNGDPDDDLIDTMQSMSLGGGSSLANKSFNSLNRQQQQQHQNIHTIPVSFPNQLHHSNDFLLPISVKSNKWNNTKVDIQKLKNAQGGFAKYASKNPISLPILPQKELLPPKVLPIQSNTESVDALVDSLVDDADKIRSGDLIKELLKPKPYPTTPVDPLDKIIPGLKAELYDHQVHGLRFLLAREKAKRLPREYIESVYGPQNDGREKTLFNVGGILADDMGLGKTVQILALLLQNQSKKKTKSKNKTTIIVCPASLICQWCTEIENKAPSLSVLSYHGPKRSPDAQFVHNYDVIVTSYPTLSSENLKSKSPLFDPEYPFRRVVLDEAHTIKNPETKAHKACCNLIAQKRWCLTGTPIQNKIGELHSLFKFLGVNKFEDSQIWNIKISNPLESRNQENIPSALNRLHKLLDKYMLRRTKQVLIDNNVLTVRKNIHREVLDFTPFERAIYEKLKNRIIKNILGNDVSIDENNSGTLSGNADIDFDYMSVFTYLLRLRQLCCHWELLFNLTGTYDDDSLMSEIKEGLLGKNTTITNNQLDDSLVDDELQELLDSMKEMHIKEKTDSTQAVTSKPGTVFNQSLHAIKLQRVLNILKKDNMEAPRKTIIFSEFTSILDILEKVLFENKIKYVRYDGKMDKQTKDDALRSLQSNPSIHVLLCSLKCGAYGLNITSCSRVILYEPFWNPAIGAQAVDRSYRIGQLKDVDVHEFYISETIEMRIKELQDKKRNLMMAVVDKDVKSAVKVIGNGLNKSELLGLLGITIPE